MVTQFQNLPDQEDCNWHASLALEYNQNFNRCHLGAYFFPNGTNTITVGPDNTPGVDVRNVDLGLSPTFRGSLTINPKIQNVIIEPAFYMGLDRWLEGAFLWFKVPIVNTRWDLDCCETNSTPGGALFDPVEGGCDIDFPLFSMFSKPPYTTPVGATTIKNAFSGTLWGDKHCSLGAARIICCEANKTGVADLPLHLGYNFINKDKGYLGIYARVVFPTGTIKNRRSIFDPRVGYDHWQFGGGLQGRATLFEKDEDIALNLFADLYVTHIFKKSECRVFDLKANGCFSRYLLMKEFDADTGIYAGNLVNFVDVFTACVESKFDWNIDGLVFFDLKYRDWIWDLGYEIKARDCESFDCECISLCNPCDADPCNDDCCCQTTDKLKGKKYGIKGNTDVVVCEFTNLDDNPNATASKTTITVAAGKDATPVYIDATNFKSLLDLNGARSPKAVSHKIWSSIGYTWSERDYPISAGFGAEIEFGDKTKVLNLWGIWAKAALAYN